MTARIEFAEVVSFQLKLPRRALERLVAQQPADLPVSLSAEGDELLLAAASGDSFLRFRPDGDDVELTEVAVCNDDRGAFFQKVLGALMLDHRGDLEVRLMWNDSDRNTDGDHADVIITQGKTRYPGLVKPAVALKNALAAGGEALFADGGGSGGAGSSDAGGSAGPDLDAQELDEIEKLLAKGKQLWDEYQRLKSKQP